MPRARLTSLIEDTIAQIATLEADIAQQKALIEERLAEGKSVDQLHTVLTLWEASLANRISERDRLQAMFDGLELGTSGSK